MEVWEGSQLSNRVMSEAVVSGLGSVGGGTADRGSGARRRCPCCTRPLGYDALGCKKDDANPTGAVQGYGACG